MAVNRSPEFKVVIIQIALVITLFIGPEATVEINGKPEIIRKYSVSYVNDMEDLAKILSLFCYQIHESGVDGWSIICGFRQEKLEGETLSNKLYVHFYSDENLAFFGFQLSFVRKEVSNLPCGGDLQDKYGWITAPDRDGDGLYDFNLNCWWTVKVPKSLQIQYQVHYVKLDPCSDDSDYLTIYEDQIGFERSIEDTYCGTHGKGRIRGTTLSVFSIHFVSNNLDVAQGFRIAYEQTTAQQFYFPVTGDGWIRPLDLNGDGRYDDLINCIWQIAGPEETAIELEIHFLQTEGLYPFCESDNLYIVYRFGLDLGFEKFCGTIGRQAIIQSYINYASVMFSSDYKYNDVGFVVSHKQINASRVHSLTKESCPGWISSLDTDQNGQYEYHAHLEWILTADETNNILLNLLYIDIEESRGCLNDLLTISYHYGQSAMICGVGFKKVFTTILSNMAYISFVSDYTINRFGFNMSFLQIAGVMQNECGAILTSPSKYITSIDANGDGLYDSGQDCLWTIMLGSTKVIVFEVLKQDIYQPAKSSKCEDDFLQMNEDHREIGKFCGKNIAPRFTTEANMLYMRFITGLMRSGKGFEAVYFQAEDEKECVSDYKCLLTDRIIQKENLCDTVNDCPYSDDERFCNFRCPRGCLCTGLSVDCTGRYACGYNKKPSSFVNQTFILSSTTRMLDVSTRHEMFLQLNLERQDLPLLTHLNLSSCEITDFPVNTFLSMKLLKVLDLSFNKIRQLKGKIFLSLASLETFLFRDNSESLIIESEAFVGFVSLQYLELSTLQIERISKGSFATLHLKELKIYRSNIIEMESLSLDKLYVENVYLNSSTIDSFTETMFHGGVGTYMFVTDEYKHCCIRPLSVQEENCYPQKDEFSSCDDLIKDKILRPLVLVIGLLSFLSNAISVIYRCWYHSEQLKFCYGIATAHLAVSDSLLGLYLIMIGITDNIFRGRYIFHDESWRGSAWCQLAGVLSTVSCEASVLFSCLITADRFLVIKYPFGQKRLTRKNGNIIAIMLWSLALFLAIFPVTLHSYFKGEFYSKSGLCLALALTRARQSGWAYAVGIFIIFNSLACLLIATGQWKIYSEIKASKKPIGDRRSKSTNDWRIARNLLLVVTTNFLCWLPVEFLGVMALADYPIPENAYTWIAVVVLPINSAVNPVLYTLSEMVQKKKKVPYPLDFQKTEYRLTADDLDKCTNLWKIPVFWSFKGQEPGFTSLTEVLQEEWFCRKERLCVAIDICKLLHKLHDWKITQEKLTTDDIFIKKTDQQRCKVVLLCRPQQMMKESDQDENMLSLGLVLSTLIKEAQEESTGKKYSK